MEQDTDKRINPTLGDAAINSPGRNTGVIIEHRDTDFQFGGVSGIIQESRNSTADWTRFLPDDERQSGQKTDSMACVTFSAMNSLETQLKWMLDNNLLPAVTLRFLRDNNYLTDTGRPNLSDRFIAKMSGTTTQGNSIQRVWDAIRKFGCVPESLWPDNLDVFDWNQFYADIPQSVKDMGVAWLQHFRGDYEFLTSKSQISLALKHAPLQIATAVCQPWSAPDPIPLCQMDVSHATMIYAQETVGIDDIFDSYQPFRKRLAANYSIPYIVKGVLTPLMTVDAPTPVPPTPISTPFHFDRDLVAGETSIDVKFLQDRLAVVQPPTGFYGTLTIAAVKKLMVDRNIGTWWEKYIYPAGRRIGPKIRTYLNTHI